MPIKPLVVRILSEGTVRAQADIRAVGDAGKDAATGLDAASKAASSLKSDLQGVAADFRRVGDSVPGAKLLDGLTSGLGNVRGQIGDVKAAMDELRNAGDGGPQGVDVGLLQKGAESAEALSGKLEGVRNAGIAVAAIGVGGIALSKALADTAEEGNAVEARLESILKAQGRLGDLDAQNEIVQNVTVKGSFADDDEIRNGAVLLDSFSVKTAHMSELLEDAARQARTMGSDVASVAQQLGTAYNSGQVGMLKKSGITVSDEELQRIENAYAISQKMGQQAFVDVLGPAIRNNTAALEDSLTASQAAANDAARAVDDFQTSAGTGAARARAEIAGIGGELLGIINKGPKLQETAGYLGTYGSYALAGVGSLVALGAQLGQLFIGYQSLKAAKALDAIATNTSTAATATNTGAQVVNAGASVANAGAASVRAGATGAASAAASANTTATDLNTAAQVRARIATLGVYAGIGLIGTAAAATVGYVAHSIAQHIGWIDKEQTFLDRLSAGWERLKGIMGGTKVEWGQNEKDLAAEIEKVKAANATAVLKGTKTQGQATKDNLSEEIKLREVFAREQLRIGDTKNMTANQERAAQLRQQQNAGQMALTPPAIPDAAPTPATSASDVTSSAPGATPNAPMVAGADKDPYADQIRALQRRKRDLKGKENAAARDALQSSIDSLQDSQRAWKEAHAAEVKAGKESTVEAKEATRKAKQEATEDARDNANLQKIRLDNRADSQIAALEAQLSAAKEAKDAKKVEALTVQIGLAKAQEAREAALIDASLESDASHKASLIAQANETYRGAEAEAKRAGARERRQMEQADSKADGKKKAPTPAEIAAIFRATGGGSRSPIDGAFSPLNPSGAAGAGKRFEQSATDWNGTQIDLAPSLWGGSMVDLGGFSRGVPGAGDFGARDEGRSGPRTIEAPMPIVRETPRGDVVRVEIPIFEIPLPSIFG